MASKYHIFAIYKDSVAFLTSIKKGWFCCSADSYYIFDAQLIEFVPFFTSVTFPPPTVND